MKSILFAIEHAEAASAVKNEVHTQVSQTISFIDGVKGFFIDNAANILAGILIMVVGYYIAKFSRHVIHSLMTRANYDQTVITFIGQVIYYSLLFLAIISGLSRWGVPSTSFVAMIGGLGLAIGLALQNNMSNFASGLLLLVFKPFRVGDWISVSGSEDIVGSVDRIELLYTAIINKERRTIFVPNSKMTSSAVINSSFNPTRYIRFDIGISYNNSHHEAMRILREIFHTCPHILNADTVEMGITAFGDNAVTISAFPEVPKEYVLATFYQIMSDIKDRFDAENIGIPYPQRDVHVYYENAPIPPKSALPVTVTGKILEEEDAVTGI